MSKILDELLDKISDIEEIDGLFIKGGFASLGNSDFPDSKSNTNCDCNCNCNCGDHNVNCNCNCDCEHPDPSEEPDN